MSFEAYEVGLMIDCLVNHKMTASCFPCDDLPAKCSNYLRNVKTLNYTAYPMFQSCSETYVWNMNTKDILLIIIGVSLSKPHTSKLNCGFFIYIIIIIIYLSYVFCMSA